MSGVEPQDSDLPKAVLKRLIKAKLQEIDKARGGDGSRDFQVNKDALLAFGEAGKLFIHYLAATANDICKDAKRQTISADDIMTALADLEFDEFVEPLKHSLEAYKAENREKNKKKAVETGKKRKAEAAPAAAAEGTAAAAEGGEEGAAAAAAGGEGAEAAGKRPMEEEAGGEAEAMGVE